MSAAPGITETVSEKRRRGRPPACSDALLSFVQGMYPDVHSRRHQANIHYMLTATSALLHAHDDAYQGRYDWLLGTNNVGRFRMTVLAELGRLGDEAAIVAWADHLCAAPPPKTARAAVATIRRVRLRVIGKDAAAQRHGLIDVLVRAINGYCEQHPELTREDIVGAIEVLEIVARQDPDDAPDA